MDNDYCYFLYDYYLLLWRYADIKYNGTFYAYKYMKISLNDRAPLFGAILIISPTFWSFHAFILSVYFIVYIALASCGVQ